MTLHEYTVLQRIFLLIMPSATVLSIVDKYSALLLSRILLDPVTPLGFTQTRSLPRTPLGFTQTRSLPFVLCMISVPMCGLAASVWVGAVGVDTCLNGDKYSVHCQWELYCFTQRPLMLVHHILRNVCTLCPHLAYTGCTQAWWGE